MVRAVVFLVALLVSPLAFAQNDVTIVRTWDVTWKDARSVDGTVTRVPVYVRHESVPRTSGVRVTAPSELDAVVRLEDRLRAAERAHGTAAVAQILSNQFFATDVDGTGRDKAAMLELVRQPALGSVSFGAMTARAVDNAVVLTGEETAGVAERRLFTHVYVRESSGEWKLLSSTTVATRR
jgi:hypothetical protein